MNKLKLSLGFRLSTSLLYFHVILEPQTKLRSSSSHASLTLSVMTVLVQWHHPLSNQNILYFFLTVTFPDIQSLKNFLIPHKRENLSISIQMCCHQLRATILFSNLLNNLQIPFFVAPFHQPHPIFSH